MAKRFIILPTLFMFFFYAQGQPSDFDQLIKDLYKNTVPLVHVNELDKMLQSGEEVVILDTRSPQEFEISSIKNAKYVGYKEFKMKSVKDIDKNAKIVLYCTVGNRSEIIGEQLQEKGYKNVYNLYGGIFEWVNNNHPVYKNDIKTDSVHTYNQQWAKWMKNGVQVYER